MTDENDNPEHLPKALIDELKAADRPNVLITSRVDREVLRRANAQFGHRRAVWRRRPAWAAVAATVLIAFFVIQLREPATIDEPVIYADVDKSGRIDIADVLAAARARQGDTDAQATLDAFAMRIVSLGTSEETS